MGTYYIEENEGDTPEVRMEGYFSMDDLMNILDEMKNSYYNDHAKLFDKAREDAKKIKGDTP